VQRRRKTHRRRSKADSGFGALVLRSYCTINYCRGNHFFLAHIALLSNL
jgi:hypothetical protein